MAQVMTDLAKHRDGVSGFQLLSVEPPSPLGEVVEGKCDVLSLLVLVIETRVGRTNGVEANTCTNGRANIRFIFAMSLVSGRLRESASTTIVRTTMDEMVACVGSAVYGNARGLGERWGGASALERRALRREDLVLHALSRAR